MGLVLVRRIVDTSRVWGSNPHGLADLLVQEEFEIGLLLMKAKNVVSHSSHTKKLYKHQEQFMH